jgi:Cu(I)/Ag(I) efflux system membrane protein CusA/SilA
MLGGLVSSAFLTLEVLPVLYTIWRYRQLKRAQRMDVTIEVALGVARIREPLPVGGESH